MKQELQNLLQAKQSTAIGYNGGGISPNPARWSGTEGDVPPGGTDVWSTACGDTDWGAGSPPENCTNPDSSAFFYPSGTDFTLQAGDVWFWQPSPLDGGTQRLRTLDELIYTYHQTVGHNTVLELDFAINRHGLVEDTHAALYKRFGDFIKQCYGEPLGRGVVVPEPSLDLAKGRVAKILLEGHVASARVALSALATVSDSTKITAYQVRCTLIARHSSQVLAALW